MNIRIMALPDESEDFIVWLLSHKTEITVIFCSEPYANRGRNDARVRRYLEVRLSAKEGTACQK